MQKYIKILEAINIGITIIFLFAYIYRLIHLRHFATTDLHKSKLTFVRLLLCAVYIILSIPFLFLSIYFGTTDSSQDKFWMFEVGAGQFVDAIILGMQMIVLRLELLKERPYTPFHLMFSIYLTLVSVIRLIFTFLIVEYQTTYSFISVSFSIAFLLNSVALLLYWIIKRQELPKFEKHQFFNFDELSNLDTTRHIMQRNIQISFMQRQFDNFSFIKPTVSVEKNQFRIILEIEDNDGLEIQDKESFAESDINSASAKKSKYTTRRTKIISDHLYSINQILELYKICGRFNIKEKLNFNNPDIVVFYKSLQTYVDELFSHRMNYLTFVLRFFDVPEEYHQFFQNFLRETLKDSEFDIYSNMDKNASIISVRIFKQLWMDDYYLFYMDVVAVNGKFESRPMRRYNDFEMFHSQLTTIIKKKYAGKYLLPNLPKKYLFNWDESKITQRRTELELYLRNLTNDYKLMVDVQEVRDLTLEFLGHFQPVVLTPVNQIFKNHYKIIQITKGSISKKLHNSEYVTFYEFKIMSNGLAIRTLRKRFNDFVILHQCIERWMTNTMINYKFLVLPEKHLYKSNTQRHEKLKIYLDSVIKVQDIWKVYEVNNFFKVGNNGMKDISMSKIYSEEEKTKGMVGSPPESNSAATQRFLDQDSFQSKGRMSALIEQLGN